MNTPNTAARRTTKVIVAGAGPTGLWLAGELRLAGVPVTVLERTQERGPYTRALAIHARTLEVLAMRAMADTPLADGAKLSQWHFGMLPSRVDFSVLDTQYPFVLAYPQPLLEDLLERRAIGLGAVVLRGHTVTGLAQDESSVRVQADGPHGPLTFEAGYAVGCDGTRSAVREAAAIAFPGTDDTLSAYLGDVTLDDPPEQGSAVVASPAGALIIAPLPGGRFRAAGFDPQDQDPDVPLTEEGIRESVRRAAGRDFGMHDATWLSRAGNATRQAAAYRAGRVLLAGDAAHMHFPSGGVGLNVGVQDAMNLGWKLAAVAQGRAPQELLDTYHAERHPVGASLLQNTLAQTALIATFTREGLALREMLSGLVADIPGLSRRLAAVLSGLDVAYRSADPLAHPLTGQRVPDLPVGDTTLFRLLASAGPVLLSFSGPGSLPVAADLAAALGIQAHPAVPWPGHEKVAVALVRPDGYLWWASGHPSDADAIEALTRLGARIGH